MIKKIDSHQHFWIFDPVKDSWIDDSMAIIRRDFEPADLKPILDKHKIDGCIAVQVEQSEKENDFLLGLTDNNDFIKGVVGWVDLVADNLRDRLQYYSSFKKFKGIRHILQGEADRAHMLNPVFMKGIGALKNYDLAYDILIFPDQLGYTLQFIKNLSGQRFVIDHIAKPDIKNKNIERWANTIKAISQYENVWCKVSGMVTEADWDNWKPEDFEPFLDVVFEAFGTKRLMFGSDWPVCNVAGGYDKWIAIVENYTAKLSISEQAAFWGQNATEFYKL